MSSPEERIRGFLELERLAYRAEMEQKRRALEARVKWIKAGVSSEFLALPAEHQFQLRTRGRLRPPIGAGSG